MIDVVNARARRIVPLISYGELEGACVCGCGQKPTAQCLIAHQAFHDSLERRYGRSVRHIITGGSRCRKHNDELIRQGVKAAKNSRHISGEALDGIWQVETAPGSWEQIPNDAIAKLAINSGLFGGVGHKEYANRGQNFVHLDVRNAGLIDVW